MAAAEDAINAAMRQLGVPYSWGGGGLDGPTIGIGRGANTIGFDCSGLVRYAFGQAGIKLPRVASDQQKATTRVAAADARPGDLVFYGATAHHVGLYLGDGKMIAAPQTGERVKVQSVYSAGDGPTYGRVKGSGAGGLIARRHGGAARRQMWPVPVNGVCRMCSDSPSAASNSGGSQTSTGVGGGAAAGTVDKRTLNKLHAVGSDLYGDEWDAKRHTLAMHVSRGRTESSKALTQAEAERIRGEALAEGERHLIALRELALRRTADRVDDQMLQYRRDQFVSPVWQTRDSLLACIGTGPGGERRPPRAGGAGRVAAAGQSVQGVPHGPARETGRLHHVPGAHRGRGAAQDRHHPRPGRRQAAAVTGRGSADQGATAAGAGGEAYPGGVVAFEVRENHGADHGFTSVTRASPAARSSGCIGVPSVFRRR